MNRRELFCPGVHQAFCQCCFQDFVLLDHVISLTTCLRSVGRGGLTGWRRYYQYHVRCVEDAYCVEPYLELVLFEQCLLFEGALV